MANPMPSQRPALPVVVLATLAAAACLGGCLSGPALQPDIVGTGELATAPPSASSEPPAAGLPRLDRSCDPSQGLGCAAGPQRPAYTIGPLDQVGILVWGRPDLGSQFQVESSGGVRATEVRQDGTLDLPFLDPLPVLGRTIQEVRHMVELAYTEFLGSETVVAAQVVRCRSTRILVEGKLRRPGVYSLCPDLLTVGELIAVAGGFDEKADESRGTLLREGAPFHLNYSRPDLQASDILLRDGDIVRFPAEGERLVYVFGEVQNQGAYPIPAEGMDLLEALAAASGYNVVTARTRKFYLVRPEDPGDPTIFELDLGQIIGGPTIVLRDGDRIFVPPTSLANWNRFWRLVLPTSVYATTSRELVR